MFRRDKFLIYPFSLSLITVSLFSADRPNSDVLSTQSNGVYYTEIPGSAGSTSMSSQTPVSFTPVKMDIHPNIPQQSSGNYPTKGKSSLLGSLFNFLTSLGGPSKEEIRRADADAARMKRLDRTPSQRLGGRGLFGLLYPEDYDSNGRAKPGVLHDVDGNLLPCAFNEIVPEHILERIRVPAQAAPQPVVATPNQVPTPTKTAAQNTNAFTSRLANKYGPLLEKQACAQSAETTPAPAPTAQAVIHTGATILVMTSQTAGTTSTPSIPEIIAEPVATPEPMVEAASPIPMPNISSFKMPQMLKTPTSLKDITFGIGGMGGIGGSAILANSQNSSGSAGMGGAGGATIAGASSTTTMAAGGYTAYQTGLVTKTAVEAVSAATAVGGALSAAGGTGGTVVATTGGAAATGGVTAAITGVAAVVLPPVAIGLASFAIGVAGMWTYNRIYYPGIGWNPTTQDYKNYDAKRDIEKRAKLINQGGGGGGGGNGGPKKDDDDRGRKFLEAADGANKLAKDIEKKSREQLRSEWQRLTNKQARQKAQELGYVESSDAPFNSHGELTFFSKKDKTWISPDTDGHTGGTWKVMDRSGNRDGTYNADLTIKIAK